ncbi:hypothetical protein F5X68DRAFT_226579 [Plectosphaerella plurivora]|uniref:ATPase AAA-type core domain-containing protein n=1 Tax=Plectosphaerella plurivora TaxID=936078 RepID=A0A9P9AH08_9PEZI|nr:hypothetical protein F5X68DRAFT_226579 [Plectosphaerella plurivora]
MAASSVSPRAIVLVARSEFEYEFYDDDDPDYPDIDNFKSIQLWPVRADRIRSLLRADESAEVRHRNTRHLQRRIRRRKPHVNKPPLSMPHAQWDFLEVSQTKKFLEKKILRDSALIGGLLEYLKEPANDEQIKNGVLSIGRRAQAADTWNYDSDSEAGSDPESDEAMAMKDEWSKFPEHAQKHLREISQDESSTYELERQLLPLLVDPVVAEDALASIAIDEELVKKVVRVVEEHQNPDAVESQYGILEREQTGGALFYGPPGTGKTLLARVLAAKTNSIVISATTTDVQVYYSG